MFSPIDGIAGVQPFNDWFIPDITQRIQLGTKIAAVDPFWGQGDFIYFKADATILKGSLVMLDEAFAGVLVPNTANTAFPFGVAMAPMPIGTFGWLQVAGRVVYKTNATVAADAAIGIAAAGIAGTLAAGKQILGVRNRIAATGTKTFTVRTYNGLGYVDANNGYDGAFLGMTLTGTGIPASTVVAGLDPNGKRILLGSAVGTFDKVATATGNITLTGTYTGFGSGIIQYPHVQGAIT